MNCRYLPPEILRPVLVTSLIAWTAIVGRSVNAQEADQEPTREWVITPRVSVGATYSDNIRLAPSSTAEGDMVFQVDPGISIDKEGRRLKLRLDYTAQGIMYGSNSDANTINNSLNAFGTAELYEKHLFLDAFGLITQSPVTADNGRNDVGSRGFGVNAGSRFALGLFNNQVLDVLPNAGEIFNPVGIFSDIALTEDQTTSASFGISPYWRQGFGGWAEALLRYRYNDTAFGEDNFDSQISSINFNLTSGRRFSILTWNFRYFYQRQDNQQQNDLPQSIEGTGDNRQERFEGRMDYRLNRTWTLLAEAGYVEEQSATIDDINNGSYWGLGAIWSPNRIYSLGAAYGENFNRIIAQWTPSTRTNLLVNREYRGVGTEPGVYWNGSFNYRTRFSTWSARYIQEVTTVQELLSNSLTGVGPDGQPVILDENGQVVIPSGPFGLTNQQFLRRYFNADATYRRGRSALSFSLFSENRELRDPQPDENAYGLGGLWSWRFAPRTASFIGTGWEHDELGDNQQNDYWVSVIGLARVFTPDSGGLISYRYYQNDAGSGVDQGFRENRFNIRFSTKF